MLDFNSVVLKFILPLATQEEIVKFTLFNLFNTSFYLPVEGYAGASHTTIYYTFTGTLQDMPTFRIEYSFGSLYISAFDAGTCMWLWKLDLLASLFKEREDCNRMLKVLAHEAACIYKPVERYWRNDVNF